MQASRCAPDHIVFSAILDAMWGSGVPAAQAGAAQLYRQALGLGMLRTASVRTVRHTAQRSQPVLACKQASKRAYASTQTNAHSFVCSTSLCHVMSCTIRALVP